MCDFTKEELEMIRDDLDEMDLEYAGNEFHYELLWKVQRMLDKFGETS